MLSPLRFSQPPYKARSTIQEIFDSPSRSGGQITTLEWRLQMDYMYAIHDSPTHYALELILTGPGYKPDGFSLGVFQPSDLNIVLDRMSHRENKARPSPSAFVRYDYECLHVKPIKHGKRQSQDTTLVFILHQHEGYEPGSLGFYSSHPMLQKCSIDENNPRLLFRNLGSYRLSSVKDWLTEGLKLSGLLGAA